MNDTQYPASRSSHVQDEDRPRGRSTPFLLRKGCSGDRTQRGPRNHHWVGARPRRCTEGHPKATPGPDKLINHNHYLWQGQSTCSCHKALVIAGDDESRDVEHAKNINLRAKMILIGFRPPGSGQGPAFNQTCPVSKADPSLPN